MTEGPPISYLVHHLVQAPPGIREQSVPGNSPGQTTAAMVSDLFYDMGGLLFIQQTAREFFTLNANADPNLFHLIRVVCYILEDRWFFAYYQQDPKARIADKVKPLIFGGLKELAQVQKAGFFLDDAEGREEICRRVLRVLELLPQGETREQAADRFTALDSVERSALVKKTREAQRRAMEIRKEMARRQAEEAASKMSRE